MRCTSELKYIVFIECLPGLKAHSAGRKQVGGGIVYEERIGGSDARLLDYRPEYLFGRLDEMHLKRKKDLFKARVGIRALSLEEVVLAVLPMHVVGVAEQE